MKFALPTLLLAGANPAASEDIVRSTQQSSAQDDASLSFGEEEQAARCENDPALVRGAEGDAQLFRDPASPNAVEPMHAVGYEVNGCELLVMTDGTLSLPQNDEGPVQVLPAQ
ncbi:hypothetical protein D2V07_00720 [Aurantiacibacter zhengii]|uniref:Uncharacterized protein n=1 Tax=Aurantiacibacter zhengii TaxID=2307003 RepID=A0A418NW87_9SPHN|nr:hypothetical protein D2V07_00720 [Aurantiacibacter zhengii]